MSSVKARKGAPQGPVAQRLALLLDAFSPWEGISLTYRQFAAELGKPVTGAAVKKWPRRKRFPAEAARLIAGKARERGLAGVTLEWLLWGEGQGPKKHEIKSHVRSTTESESGPYEARVVAQEEPYGRLAAGIGEALEADLNHNEFGQWSSVEVQRTVIWALKDLARRLRVLRFDMGKTFELTDALAAKVGLPVRMPEQPAHEER
jgi:hypothetical protein